MQKDVGIVEPEVVQGIEALKRDGVGVRRISRELGLATGQAADFLLQTQTLDCRRTPLTVLKEAHGPPLFPTRRPTLREGEPARDHQPAGHPLGLGLR